jgi:putative transcriptional regulator
MSEKMSDFVKDLVSGLQEAADYINGKPHNARVTTYVFADAKAIREQLGMSQSEFCKTYGIPINTLQNWEQRRSNPDRTASAYLWAIAELPRQISEAQIRHRNEKPGGTEMMAFY